MGALNRNQSRRCAISRLRGFGGTLQILSDTKESLAATSGGVRTLKRYFTKKQLSDLNEKLATIDRRAGNLLIKYVWYPFKNEQAREYAQQGFGRRVGTLQNCIKNVFRVVPPGTVKVPAKARLHNAQINIQAFVANVYGSIDNLAWIWVYERGLAESISRKQVGLRKHHEKVRSSLSVEFRTYLEGLDKWFEWIVEYRDALAHRIPLYVPPGAVRPEDVDAYNTLMVGMNEAMNQINSHEYNKLSAEQSKLLVFQPLITHSVREAKAHYVFHAQLIADFLTIEELGEKMLIELGKIKKDPTLV
jgi:hypothetical protein